MVELEVKSPTKPLVLSWCSCKKLKLSLFDKGCNQRAKYTLFSLFPLNARLLNRDSRFYNPPPGLPPGSSEETGLSVTTLHRWTTNWSSLEGNYFHSHSCAINRHKQTTRPVWAWRIYLAQPLDRSQRSLLLARALIGSRKRLCWWDNLADWSAATEADESLFWASAEPREAGGGWTGRLNQRGTRQEYHHIAKEVDR